MIELVDDPVAARARLAAGDVLQRHFLRMVLDLTRPLAHAPVPPGFTVAAAGAEHLADYGRVVSAAYVVDHIDHEPADDDPASAAQVIAGYFAGDEPGPWIAAASCHAVGSDGGIAGLVVMSAYTPGGGEPRPWITDLTVDPRWAGRGLGAALVMTAAARLVERGYASLGLAVTVGNPARGLYERLGFRRAHEVWRFEG
jgi:ribosomal protein S18 acetylase RimI-like enzyme